MGACNCQSDKSNAEEIQRKSSRTRKRMSENPLHAIRHENPSMPPIQARLTVGPAHDAFEQEADRIADEVMRMPAPVSAHTFAQDGTGGLEHGVKRDPAEGEELQRKPLAARIIPLLQRQPLQREDLEDEELQRDALEEDELQRMGGDEGFEADEGLSRQIQSARGGGQPLESNSRSFMEARFGSDFSDVRVHADSEAARLSRDLSAHAFTLGNDIFFGAGQYQPESDSGKHLLAHELTHVVQQGGNVRRQRMPLVGNIDPRASDSQQVNGDSIVSDMQDNTNICRETEQVSLQKEIEFLQKRWEITNQQVSAIHQSATRPLAAIRSIISSLGNPVLAALMELGEQHIDPLLAYVLYTSEVSGCPRLLFLSNAARDPLSPSACVGINSLPEQKRADFIAYISNRRKADRVGPQPMAFGLNLSSLALSHKLTSKLQEADIRASMKFCSKGLQIPSSAMDWGLQEKSMSGKRASKGYHKSGDAVDFDTEGNPYIMHERGESELDSQLKPVYHRISLLILNRLSIIPEDLVKFSANSRPIDQVKQMHMKLREESEAMAHYFRLFNLSDKQLMDVVQKMRELNPNASTYFDTKDLLHAANLRMRLGGDYLLLGGERKILKSISTHEVSVLAKAPPTLDDKPITGPDKSSQQDRPFSGRDPSRGFLSLKPEMVDALLEVGLSWGAIDIPGEPGDVMHFDIRSKLIEDAPQQTAPSANAPAPVLQRHFATDSPKVVIQRSKAPCSSSGSPFPELESSSLSEAERSRIEVECWSRVESEHPIHMVKLIRAIKAKEGKEFTSPLLMAYDDGINLSVCETVEESSSEEFEAQRASGIAAAEEWLREKVMSRIFFDRDVLVELKNILAKRKQSNSKDEKLKYLLSFKDRLKDLPHHAAAQAIRTWIQGGLLGPTEISFDKDLIHYEGIYQSVSDKSPEHRFKNPPHLWGEQDLYRYLEGQVKHLGMDWTDRIGSKNVVSVRYYSLLDGSTDSCTDVSVNTMQSRIFILWKEAGGAKKAISEPFTTTGSGGHKFMDSKAFVTDVTKGKDPEQQNDLQRELQSHDKEQAAYLRGENFIPWLLPGQYHLEFSKLKNKGEGKGSRFWQVNSGIDAAATAPVYRDLNASGQIDAWETNVPNTSVGTGILFHAGGGPKSSIGCQVGIGSDEKGSYKSISQTIGDTSPTYTLLNALDLFVPEAERADEQADCSDGAESETSPDGTTR